jgi:diguanylate cyclase (GGDEF)-like protein/PAS domain S-box-containing protein
MVEDVVTEAELAVRQLRRDGLIVDARRVETPEDFIAEIEDFKPDLILSDYSLPKFDGFAALSIAYQRVPDIPFIFLSGTIGEETAIDALKGGAVDYVLKTNLNRLAPAVRRALDEARTRAAHMQAESRFRDLIEFAPHAIVVINENGLIEIVNEQTESLFGYARDEVVGTASEVLIPGRFCQWHEVLNGDAGTGAAPAVLCFEVLGRRKNGTDFPAEISLSPLKTESGLWVSSVIRDISARKEQESRIERLSRIHTVLSGINTAIVRIRDRREFLDEACRIAVEAGLFATAWIGMLDKETLRLEPEAWAGAGKDCLVQFETGVYASSSSTACPASRALGSKSSIVINDIGSDPQVAPWRRELIEHGYRSLCVMPLVVDSQAMGALILYATQADVFNEEEQRLLTMVAADIAFALDYFSKKDRLNYLAYFDPITGLPNRALFQDRLGQLIAQDAAMQREQVAVVLLGLDRFRNINDTFGRGAADELLREVARRLRDNLPDAGYLARIHADCFAFVMKENRRETDVINLLERKVAACFSEPVLSLGKDVRISATAGIVLFPTDGDDVDALLRNAEAALKNAKAAKVSYLFYTAEMNARAAEKLSIENRLRRALDQDQFVLHYQPKLDLVSGQIAGLEALIRWEEPGVGLVPPGKFIHVLEDTGLIVDVGNWVIARAHQQYQEWAARGLAPPRIAVNVSQLQIRQKDFMQHMLGMLDILNPAEFELEITESLFMEGGDQEATKTKLAALRERGVTMAIDDFGTGYSSLSYIAQLPIDTLKIDRSFIDDMTTSRDHMAIVSTIISLAHSLKLKVVAEGVETNEQLGLLKALECDQIQGFLCSRTLPPEQIEAKLALRAA